MARMLTSGAESGHLRSDNITIVTGTTVDNTVFRSGANSFKHVGNSEATLNATLSSSSTYYARAYQLSAALPGSGMASLLHADNTALLGAWLDSTGRLGLGWDNGGSPVFLGAGSFTWVNSQWIRIELKVIRDGLGNYSSAELRADGTTVDTWTGTIPVNFGRFEVGDSSGTGFAHWSDDIAVNDTSGSAQTSWPGPGSVVNLLPVSDSANTSGNWLKPGGASTGLFSSLDNVPPVGIAHSTSAGDADKQIYNIASSATDDYDANLMDYTSAGIGANDTITVVSPYAVTGSNSTTDTAGGIRLVSNPSQSELGFTTFDQSAVAGTFPTGWLYVAGSKIYAPSVTKGTSPVLRVGKRTAATRAAMLAQMGAVVEYIPVTIQAVVQGGSTGLGNAASAVAAGVLNGAVALGQAFNSNALLDLGQALGQGNLLDLAKALAALGSSTGSGENPVSSVPVSQIGTIGGSTLLTAAALASLGPATGAGYAVSGFDFATAPFDGALADGTLPTPLSELDLGSALADGLIPEFVTATEFGGADTGFYEIVISQPRREPSRLILVDPTTSAALHDGKTVVLLETNDTTATIRGRKTFVTIHYG